LLLTPVIGGCGDGGTGPGKKGVGEEGGKVTLAGGSVVLVIPTGALPSFVKFTVDPATSIPPSDLVVPGATYEIGPPGTTFDRLATLTLAYDPADLPASVRESELGLHQMRGINWVPAVNGSVDTDAHTVSGLIETLGTFGVLGFPVKSVALSPSFQVLAAGETRKMTAAGIGPSGSSFPGREVAWSSSDESVATVDTEGLVTAVGPGNATIQARVEFAAKSATIRVYDCAAQTDIPRKECEALEDVLGSLTKGDWRSSTLWVQTPDPCTWRGVTCEGGYVSEFSYVGHQGSGPISYSIGDLSHLRVLDLSINGLTGSIPPTIGNMASLEVLYLHSNDLSGPIPPEVGNLTNLRELYLYWNEISGQLPPQLGNLTNLRDLRLNGNQISGPLPPELGNLSSVVYLSLFDNQFFGPIPAELGGLANLERLSLSLNELSGGIPPELGNLSSLSSLGLSGNNLSGPIPPAIGNLSNLTLMVLEDNQLSGTVPLAVAALGARIQLEGRSDDCRFAPPGNEGLTIPDTQEYRDADLDADGVICGVAIGGG